MFEWCPFVGNSSADHGTIALTKTSSASINQWTFCGNSTTFGGTLSYESSCLFDVENTIIAFGTRGSAVAGESGEAVPSCCDIFGNAGGDWIGPIGGQLGMNGNICADLLFVDPAAEDFRLLEGSPCAPFTPPNPACDLIGA